MYDSVVIHYTRVRMIAKRQEKEKAIQLRQQGWGIKEIGKKLGVAKSSASIWCRGINLNETQLERLRNKRPNVNYGAIANKEKRQQQIEKIKEQAKKEIKPFNISDLTRLKDLGTALYWAEGRKAHIVDITNSDPEIIKIAMLWFRIICKVPEKKFKISIYYHSGQNEQKMKKYWSNITNIPLNQFNKSIFKREGTGHRKRILYNGTCKIVVCDSDLLHRILTWIEQLHLKDGPVAQW